MNLEGTAEEVKQYAKAGRPKKGAMEETLGYPMVATAKRNQEEIDLTLNTRFNVLSRAFKSE